MTANARDPQGAAAQGAPPSGLTPPRDVLTILRRPIARLAGEDDPGAVANGYDWKYLLGVLDRALAPTSPVAGAPQHEN